MALVRITAAAERAAEGKSASTARDAEAQRKKARTLAKQQQAAERVAAAASELASGIAEASSAAEELKRASDQVAAGAEEASGAAQESLTAFQQVSGAIGRQLQLAGTSQTKLDNSQQLTIRTDGEHAPSRGARIQLHVNEGAVHAFSTITGNRLG
jgi:methyl-accepting chemotaxis protein